MLSIGRVTGSRYLLGGGSGCGAHKHLSDPSAYAMDGVSTGEPPGKWAHRGENVLGLEGDIHAEGPSGDGYRSLVDKLQHPTTGEQLGQAPANYKSTAERVAEFVERNPRATSEEVREYELMTGQNNPSAVMAWDLVFSPAKSWSVLHAAYERAGRHDDAAKLWAALEVGVHAALDHLFDEVLYVRRGVHGPKAGAGAGRATGPYEQVRNAVMAVFRHHVSRERDPQLHIHVNLINRALDQDGTWRALFADSFLKSRQMLNATYERAAEAEATRTLGLSFVTRPDGLVREIEGVEEEVRDHFSSRSRKLTEYAQELVDAYTAKWGVAPNARRRWQILQYATRKNRPKKPEQAPTREQDLDRFEATLTAKTERSLFDVLDQVDALTVAGGYEPPPAQVDRENIIKAALAELAVRRGTATRDDLFGQINRRLPDMLGLSRTETRTLLTSMVDEALAHRDTVSTQAKPAVPVPASLRNPKTGRSKFEAPIPRRFTTRDHLAKEESLVARLDHRGGFVVPVGTVKAILAGRGLGVDQEEFATGVLSTDHRFVVGNAPAGSGKSYTVKAISDVVEQVTGIGVTAFTLSEIAADVLRGEGIGRAHNIDRWLTHQRLIAEGKGDEVEDATYAVGRVVVIDEASMVDTPKFTELLTELDRLGVRKVIVVGDTAQIDAVDAGGGFSMLVREVERRQAEAAKAATPEPTPEVEVAENADELMAAWTRQPEREKEPVRVRGAASAPPKVHRLTEVRRFRWAWERKASTDLREGRVEALRQYEARRRVMGSFDPSEVLDAAAEGFARDHLSGKESVVVTSTTEEAADVASRIRQRLAEKGHVEQDGVRLRDKNTAGVGDVIQTRLNDRDLQVTNRRVWQVVGRTDQDALEVQPLEGRDEHGQLKWGQPLALPASYVRTQVELAYAATVEGVQGRTTDTGHLVAGPTMGRSSAYPGLMRGREANYAYVMLDPTPELGAAQAKVHALEHRVKEAVGDEGRGSAQVALEEARRDLAAAQDRAPTPVGRLAAIFADDDHTQAARVEIEIEEQRATSLAHLGPQWEAMVRESRAITHRDMIVAALGDEADLVLSDPANGRLYALLRDAELKGHEPAEVLDTVMHHTDGRRHTLAGTRSPLSALYVRVEEQLKVGPANVRPVPTMYERRLPEPSLGDVENERLQFGRATGKVMDDRAAQLGREIADEQPEWAVRALGPVPDDAVGRYRWIGNIAHTAAFREQYGWDDPQRALPRKPSHMEPEKVWLWDLAARQIGIPEHDRNLAALTDGDLLNRVADWDRKVPDLPRFVDDDLRDVHRDLRSVEDRIVARRSAGDDTTLDEADRAQIEGRMRMLEEIAERRASAMEATREVRERADEAQRELDRRAELDRAAAGEHLNPLPDPDVAPEPEPEVVREPEVEPNRTTPEPDRWAAADAEVEARARVFADWTAARAIPSPAFGSPEWVALADDDPAKHAAVIQTAARGYRGGEPVWRDREAIYRVIDEDRARFERDERIARSAEKPGRAALPTPADDRAGDLTTPADEIDRLTVHAGDEAAPITGADDDTLTRVLEWAQQRWTDGTPEYGTPEYAALPADDPRRGDAEARAALDVWNLGDDLGELHQRWLSGPLEEFDERVDDEPEPWVEDIEPMTPIPDPEPADVEPPVVEPDPEPEPDPVDDEERFQAGLEYTLRAAREAAPAPSPKGPGSVPEPEDEPGRLQNPPGDQDLAADRAGDPELVDDEPTPVAPEPVEPAVPEPFHEPEQAAAPEPVEDATPEPEPDPEPVDRDAQLQADLDHARAADALLGTRHDDPEPEPLVDPVVEPSEPEPADGF